MKWLAWKWNWAKQNPLFWYNLLLVVLTVCTVNVWRAPGTSDFRVRTLGMLFQLVGVVTVWLDLTATARVFRKPGAIRSTWKWLQSGIFGKATVISVSGVAVGSSIGRARITVRASINPTSPVLERLDSIEKNLANIDGDIHEAFSEISRLEAEIRSEIRQEIDARKNAVKSIQTDIESLTNGNSTVLLFGVIWLGIGIVLSTWAAEISKIAAGSWNVVFRTL